MCFGDIKRRFSRDQAAREMKLPNRVLMMKELGIPEKNGQQLRFGDHTVSDSVLIEVIWLILNGHLNIIPLKFAAYTSRFSL